MTERIRVLIADDHPVVRQGMNLFLETQPDIEVVALAENGLRAVQLTEEFLPDVVLMDLNMPELNGIEATKRIRADSPHTQVVVLTSHVDSRDPRCATGHAGRLYRRLANRRRQTRARRHVH